MNRRNFLATSLMLTAPLVSGAWYWDKRWKYIAIHHSAGEYGSIPFLRKVHRQRQSSDPVDAIPYHYVIGNGNGMGMGEIATGWRQSLDIWGAHVSSRNHDWNLRGIGICLIGNFENHSVPEQQYAALLSLTKDLMRQYGISGENVNGHGFITGERTKCPGKHFPIERFRKDILTTTA
ncbi:MAG: peptidoglycan recognition family protein [Candidatus Thiodiazotropha sp.]|jgi:N-acetylmuramoyl-L-alanine amidase